jgi:sulfite exporter TauE/SafE/copper chaperone CopZ
MTITKKFKAKGMHCTSCETLIERINIEGIEKIKADYPSETVTITYDETKTNMQDIFKAVEEKGYECSLIIGTPKDNNSYTITKSSLKKFFGITFGLIGILVIGYFIFNAVEKIAIPTISANMGYGLLFLVGLLTGFHCVSMCGGFVVSYTAKNAQAGKKSYKSHLMYGTGKLISYTVIGAAFGLLGSIIAFTPMMRGIAGIIAGLFLVVFGLNMLNIFPVLRKIRLKTPKFLNNFSTNHTQKGPLVIGLLNGLMIACGPLQAIYIMAAGTGSMIEGAKLLFMFALGTLPVMIGFGFITSMISSKATHKILKASGAIVIILGLVMVNRGLALTGTGFDIDSLTGNSITGDVAAINGEFQTIRMDVTRSGYEPNTFVLEKGVPVKWIITGKELTGCNNAIQVPKYDLEFDIKQGEQIIEFTPKETGTVSWSCWMGMIPGKFIITDENSNEVEVQQQVAAKPQGGSCGGGCGCGGK